MTDTVLPEAERKAAPDSAAGDVGRARVENLLGLISPISNLGMRRLAPPDLRWFGVGAGVVLWALALYGFKRGNLWLAGAAAAAHVALVLMGLVNPRLPEVPGRLWIGLGMAMGKFMAYPMFGVLYFLVVAPTAVLVRLFVGDPLKRKAPKQDSYWVDRKPGTKAQFERQF
ncbi:MAG: hypothetical protein K8T90_21665 [Planctomycetes bacterium]|nr:hypothetical protein [Planctomycetota bacterium]